MKHTLPVFLALTLTSTSFGQSLSEQLKEREAKGSTRVTPEIKAAFGKGIEAIKTAKVVEGARQVGDNAPDFTLKNASGKAITLSEQLKQGPVVLTWYRGGWCPYCNLALAAMQKELPAIKKAGASLIALTPELPDRTLTTKEKNSLTFEVLTDLNHQVAKEYGLLFKLTPEVAEIYKRLMDLEAYNGAAAGADTLPLAATYIIGQNGKILWAFLHHDYHMRAEPKDVVDFLHGLERAGN